MIKIVDTLNGNKVYFEGSLDDLKENQLVLGPFCGMPATTRIDIGRGVCGTSFEKGETYSQL